MVIDPRYNHAVRIVDGANSMILNTVAAAGKHTADPADCMKQRKYHNVQIEIRAEGKSSFFGLDN